MTFDFMIGDFTADIALEGDNTADSITLESHTPTGIGDILLTANGDRLVHENDGGGDRFFLSENSFARSLGLGTNLSQVQSSLKDFFEAFERSGKRGIRSGMSGCVSLSNFCPVRSQLLLNLQLMNLLTLSRSSFDS